MSDWSFFELLHFIVAFTSGMSSAVRIILPEINSVSEPMIGFVLWLKTLLTRYSSHPDLTRATMIADCQHQLSA